ncbi:hypothetical protein NC652_014089 [Populus alba x Populus x berolinensis]|nr:hypothetical protein NC652_014089 [Populus alba x Populus x berolinensis]
MELPLLLSPSLCSPFPHPLDSCNSSGRVDQFLDGFVLEAYINFSIQSLGVCQIITCSCGGIVFFSGTHFSGKRKGAKIILLLLKINYLFLKF